MLEHSLAKLLIAPKISSEKSCQGSGLQRFARAVFVPRSIQSHEFEHTTSRCELTVDSRPIQVDENDVEADLEFVALAGGAGGSPDQQVLDVKIGVATAESMKLADGGSSCAGGSQQAHAVGPGSQERDTIRRPIYVNRREGRLPEPSPAPPHDNPRARHRRSAFFELRGRVKFGERSIEAREPGAREAGKRVTVEERPNMQPGRGSRQVENGCVAAPTRPRCRLEQRREFSMRIVVHRRVRCEYVP